MFYFVIYSLIYFPITFIYISIYLYFNFCGFGPPYSWRENILYNHTPRPLHCAPPPSLISLETSTCSQTIIPNRPCSWGEGITGQTLIAVSMGSSKWNVNNLRSYISSSEQHYEFFQAISALKFNTYPAQKDSTWKNMNILFNLTNIQQIQENSPPHTHPQIIRNTRKA